MSPRSVGVAVVLEVVAVDELAPGHGDEAVADAVGQSLWRRTKLWRSMAESKGVEPLYRFTDSLGLANLHITALSTLLAR